MEIYLNRIDARIFTCYSIPSHFQGGFSMNKLFYPAIFHVAEEGGFWITFPDLPECMTQGDNMQEALMQKINL